MLRSASIKNIPGLYAVVSFLSIHGKAQGCLDEKCEWIPDGIFYRNTFLPVRFKFFKSTGLIYMQDMISQ